MPAKTRPLKVGLFLPSSEKRMAGETPRWQDVAALARRAEEIGFDSIWIPDHMIFEIETEPRERVGAWECWSFLAGLAAVTSRVEIGPIVSCTSFRNPAMLAKIADTVDEMSGGRLILGLGAGWNAAEYRAYGFPFDHRASRFEEAFTIIRRLLREGQVDFEGTYYQARDCELRPRGPRPHGPPILIGTRGERMLRLTAEHADMWNMWATEQLDPAADVPPVRATVDAACRAVGRDPATLVRTAALQIAYPGETGYRPGYPGWRQSPLRGETDQIAAVLRGYAAEGIAHVQVWIDPSTLAGLEAFAPVLAALDRG